MKLISKDENIMSWVRTSSKAPDVSMSKILLLLSACWFQEGIQACFTIKLMQN